MGAKMDVIRLVFGDDYCDVDSSFLWLGLGWVFISNLSAGMARKWRTNLNMVKFVSGDSIVGGVKRKQIF